MIQGCILLNLKAYESKLHKVYNLGGFCVIFKKMIKGKAEVEKSLICKYHAPSKGRF